MKPLAAIGAVVLGAAMLASPATGNVERKTELVKDGQAVDSLYFKAAFTGLWVLDNQNILFQDDVRDYYLVSFETKCAWIHRLEDFKFVPKLGPRAYASRTYEARRNQEDFCDVSGIRQVATLAEAKAIVGK